VKAISECGLGIDIPHSEIGNPQLMRRHDAGER